MGQTADQLRQEIDQKRDDAAQKIDELQSQVQGAAQKVTDTAMQVKESFDVRRQIEDKPLLALGAALVGGFLLGGMGGGDGLSAGGRDERDAHGSAPIRSRSGIRQAAKSSGLEDALTHAGSALMSTLADRLKAALDQSFPGFADKLEQAQQQGTRDDASDDRVMETRGTVSTGRPAPPYAEGTVGAPQRQP